MRDDARSKRPADGDVVPTYLALLPGEGGRYAVMKKWGIAEWGYEDRKFLPNGVDVTMELEVIDGVPHCVEVRFATTREDRGVPAKAIREFRLEDWIERACEGALWLRHENEEARKHYSDIDHGDTLRSIRRARAKARGGYTDEMLREVAAIYVENAAHHPTKAVREAFGVAQSTAQLYVKKARDAGFLEPPPSRRAEKS